MDQDNTLKVPNNVLKAIGRSNYVKEPEAEPGDFVENRYNAAKRYKPKSTATTTQCASWSGAG